MSRTSNTPTPSLRRELLVILGWLGLAAFVFRVGHIPGVVNSATLIAVGASIWAAWKLATLLRRAQKHAATVVRAKLAEPPHGVSVPPVALRSHRNAPSTRMSGERV